MGRADSAADDLILRGDALDKTFHATEADGPDALELVCFFTPPVVSGSYEKKAGS